MSAKEQAEYQKWLEEVKQEYPEDLREALDKLAAVDTTKELFYRGTIRQKDYYTKLNKLANEKREVESKATKMEEWYQNEALPEYNRMENELKKAEAERQKLLLKVKELGIEDEVGNLPTRADIRNADSIKEVEQLKAQLQAIDRALPSILSEMTSVQHKVLSEKWDVDPTDVLNLSMQKNIKPTAALEEMISVQREERKEKEMEALKKKWMDEGRKDALAKNPGSPDRLRPSGPTVVDALRNTSSKANGSVVDDAVKQFLELSGGAMPGGY